MALNFDPDDPQVAARFTTGLPPVLPSLSKPDRSMSAGPPPLTPSTNTAAGLPPVTSLTPSPEEQRVASVRSKLDKLQQTPSFTAGLWDRTKGADTTLGKVGHVGAGILRGVDIAGEMLAPNIARNIPGTGLNRSQNIAQAQGELGQAEKESVATRKTPETQAFEGDRAAGKTPLQAYQDVEAAKRAPGKDKEEDWSIVPGMTGPHGEAVQQEKNSGQMRYGSQVQPLKPTEAKDEEWSVVPGVTDPTGHLLEHEKHSNQLRVANEIGKPTKPQQEPGNYQPVMDTKGNTLGWVDPKSRHFVSVSQIGGLANTPAAPNNMIPPKPTSTTLTQAQGASAVQGQATKLNPMIDALASKIGPGAGRWNNFWVNKAGVNDPDYAQLQEQLELYASGVVKVHFGARGGGQQYIQKMVQDFSLAQSPENLKARIAGADDVLAGYAAQAGHGQVSFKVGNDFYDIPQDKIKAFTKKHPDAEPQ